MDLQSLARSPYGLSPSWEDSGIAFPSAVVLVATSGTGALRCPVLHLYDSSSEPRCNCCWCEVRSDTPAVKSRDSHADRPRHRYSASRLWRRNPDTRSRVNQHPNTRACSDQHAHAHPNRYAHTIAVKHASQYRRQHTYANARASGAGGRWLPAAMRASHIGFGYAVHGRGH